MIVSLFAAALAAAPVPQPLPAAAGPIIGIWHNPKDTVVVRTGACGDKLCGWVIRATEHARSKVRAKGQPELIGTALLRDYKATGHYRWSGDAYVPDMGRSFSSTITMNDVNTITVRGCLIGGLFCKSQVWKRD